MSRAEPIRILTVGLDAAGRFHDLFADVHEQNYFSWVQIYESLQLDASNRNRRHIAKSFSYYVFSSLNRLLDRQDHHAVQTEVGRGRYNHSHHR